MNKYIITLSLSLATATTFGQGLVNFYNTPTTLISSGPFTAASPINGPPESYYFGLLISPSGLPGTFSFSGLYATNQATPGLFSGGAGVAVPGWAAGATFWYEVAGWSANLGHDWNPQWLIGIGLTNYFQYHGVSSPGEAVAGGYASQAKLSVSVSGESIFIFWTPTGGTLQSSPSLGAGETWSVVGRANPAKVAISANAKFFRVVPDVNLTPDLFGPSGVQGFNLAPGPV